MYFLHKVTDDFFYVDEVSDGEIYSGDADSIDVFIGNATMYLKNNDYDIFSIENKT